MTFTINFDDVAAWFRSRKERRAARRKAKAEAAAAKLKTEGRQRLTRQIVRKATQGLLADGIPDGGMFTIEHPAGKLSYWKSVSAVHPQSREELAEHCDWWIIDTDKSYDNLEKLSRVQIDHLLDNIDVDDYLA